MADALGSIVIATGHELEWHRVPVAGACSVVTLSQDGRLYLGTFDRGLWVVPVAGSALSGEGASTLIPEPLEQPPAEGEGLKRWICVDDEMEYLLHPMSGLRVRRRGADRWSAARRPAAGEAEACLPERYHAFALSAVESGRLWMMDCREGCIKQSDDNGTSWHTLAPLPRLGAGAPTLRDLTAVGSDPERLLVAAAFPGGGRSAGATRLSRATGGISVAAISLALILGGGVASVLFYFYFAMPPDGEAKGSALVAGKLLLLLGVSLGALSIINGWNLSLIAPVLIVPGATLSVVPASFSRHALPTVEAAWVEAIPEPAVVVREGGTVVRANRHARRVLPTNGFKRDFLAHDGVVAATLLGSNDRRYVAHCEPIPAAGGVPSGLFLCVFTLQVQERRLPPASGRTRELQDAFTERERDVVGLLVRGFSYRRIGEELCISEATVRTHVHHIYRKSGAEDRAGLLSAIHATPRGARKFAEGGEE